MISDRESVFPDHQRCGLLVVDVQQRLIPAIAPDDVARLIKSHLSLIEMCKSFDIPIWYTEQYPKGLGSTVPELLEALEGVPKIEKTEFSACQNESFRRSILTGLPKDIILTGIETHVCVLQTAADLIESEHRVFVPRDAVASRTRENRENGLSLMERLGAVITNSETLVFHRLGKAGGDVFKRLSKLVR